MSRAVFFRVPSVFNPWPNLDLLQLGKALTVAAADRELTRFGSFRQEPLAAKREDQPAELGVLFPELACLLFGQLRLFAAGERLAEVRQKRGDLTVGALGALNGKLLRFAE